MKATLSNEIRQFERKTSVARGVELGRQARDEDMPSVAYMVQFDKGVQVARRSGEAFRQALQGAK